MPRFIPITNLTQGMRSDDVTPGTLREAVDVLPWRGALRRRGPITSHASLPSNKSVGAGIVAGYNLMGGGIALNAGGSDFCGLSGSTWSYLGANSSGAQQTFQMDRELVMCGTDTSLNGVRCWGGAVAADAAAGGITLTTTAGSTRATFGSAVGSASLVAGMYLQDVTNDDYHLIRSVVSTTEVILNKPARRSIAHTNWNLISVAPLMVSNSASGGGMFMQANAGASGSATLKNTATGSAGCMHQGRLFLGNIYERSWNGTNSAYVANPGRIRWSALSGETDSNNFKGTSYFNNDAFLDLGDEGGKIVAMYSHNGALVVLRENAVQVITGGFATDGSYLGATVNTVARGIGVRNAFASVGFEQGVAFADANGCYVWDGGQVTNLTSGVIGLAWRGVMASSPSSIRLSAPGDRLVASYTGGTVASAYSSFVFDFGTRSWYRMQTKYKPTCIAELSNGKFIGGLDVGATDKTYEFRTVFEDLDTDNADRALDTDGDVYPSSYVLTNPIPLVDGFQTGRVSEVVLNDGGNTTGGMTYVLRLLPGPIYSKDTFSGEADVVTRYVVGSTSIPEITGNEVDQRSVKVRLDGSNESPFVMVELAVGAAASTDTFAWALFGVGLVVEDNPTFSDA